MSGFPSFFARIRKAGDLPPDVTPHVLRHSFASIASDLGFSEATIATLVGHKGQSVTSRYTHSADAVLLAAADTVADRIAQHLSGTTDEDQLPHRTGRQEDGDRRPESSFNNPSPAVLGV